MKLFLCWSGDRSHAFAVIVQKWLPRVIGESLQPELSDDIQKGVMWFTALDGKLKGAGAGILCLTPEALSSDWIHYEAGALAVRILENDTESGDDRGKHAGRIFTYLLGVSSGELSGPLAAYQATQADNRADTARLLEAIATLMPTAERIQGSERAPRFDREWAAFQKDLADIKPVTVGGLFRDPAFEQMFKRKTFDEPLQDCTNQTWLARYDGIKETLARLRPLQATVHRACRRYHADVFDALLAELDAYAMSTSLLIGREQFDIDDEGRVKVLPVGLGEACERRRQRIRGLVARLVDPDQDPVFEEAFRFEAAETFEERKSLVHRKIAELDRGNEAAERRRWALSGWDFDRITYYAHKEKVAGGAADVGEALGDIRMELERVRAKVKRASRMALHYSLRRLRAAVHQPGAPDLGPDVRGLLKDVRDYLQETGGDEGGQIRRVIGEIEAILGPM